MNVSAQLLPRTLRQWRCIGRCHDPSCSQLIIAILCRGDNARAQEARDYGQSLSDFHKHFFINSRDLTGWNVTGKIVSKEVRTSDL
jgi:hypothetical protein